MYYAHFLHAIHTLQNKHHQLSGYTMFFNTLIPKRGCIRYNIVSKNLLECVISSRQTGTVVLKFSYSTELFQTVIHLDFSDQFLFLIEVMFRTSAPSNGRGCLLLALGFCWGGKIRKLYTLCRNMGHSKSNNNAILLAGTLSLSIWCLTFKNQNTEFPLTKH